MCLSELLGIPSKDIQVSLGLNDIVTYTIRTNDYATAETKLDLLTVGTLNAKISDAGIIGVRIDVVNQPDEIVSKIAGTYFFLESKKHFMIFVILRNSYRIGTVVILYILSERKKKINLKFILFLSCY